MSTGLSPSPTAVPALRRLGLDRLPAEIRPVPALMKYYAVALLPTFVAYPIVLLFHYARYRTLRYSVDEDGITARWGVLFRREVSLNYDRIQDIHLSSNLVERWLGLGKIQVQTASASSKAELTMEGVPALDAVRDFLYSRMRGARHEHDADTASPVAPSPAVRHGTATGELAETLRAVAAEVRALRRELEERGEAGDA